MPLPPNEPCLCGCGQIPKSPGRKWCAGHNETGPRSAETRARLSLGKRGSLNPRFGKRPANYKGVTVHGDGYILVHVPEHPYASKHTGNVMQHRLVMEQRLRANEPDSPYLIDVDGTLYLRRDLEVHHVNHVKDDNRLSNLIVLTKREHAALHHAERALISPPKRVRRKKPQEPAA